MVKKERSSDMAYIIVSLIIYLILALFFWSLCAINNRRSFEESESALRGAEVEGSVDEILVESYSYADSV
jgi:hypothetical protein